MAGLYKYFITTAAIFVSFSILLSLLPFVRFDSHDETPGVILKDITRIYERKSRDYKLPEVWNGNHYKLPELWHANRESDRIPLQIEFKPKTRTKSIKYIHLEHSFDVLDGQDVFKEQKCKIQNCALVSSPRPEKKMDARLFKQDIDFLAIDGLLERIPRSREQVWVIYILESPLASPDYFLLDGVFNWSATYRTDSTIVAPYERWMPSSNIDKNKIHKNYAHGKSKKVAIFVSNCNAVNNRMSYIKELSSFIKVDVYGGCGTLSCSRDDENSCFKLLQKDYKFYLSFENGNCRDYITEKFFRNGLMSDVLPIVMGAHPDDYRKVAPPNSYIHVEDFESPKELASYLHKLDKNDTLYNEYFKWKGTGSFINTKFWCRLCAMLNDPNKPELIVENMESWWRPKNICLRPGQRWKDLQDS